MPASPSPGPLKRSIHEVDDADVQSLGPKRPLTDFAGENQENKDPRTTQMSKSDSPSPQRTSTLAPPSVEVSINDGVKNSSTDSEPHAHRQSITSQDQASPAKSDMAATPTSKKRKLSVGGKDIKQQEKDVKERQRLEEKQKKEEEKRLRAEEKKQREAKREEEKKMKEEERKKREAEREEKRKAKEDEKAAKEAAKEEEKRRKEEEKLKKEQASTPRCFTRPPSSNVPKAQPKLNSFFAKPPLASTSTATTSLSSPCKQLPADDKSPAKTFATRSDYAKAFPDFFLQSHTIVAPTHRFERDSQLLEHVRNILDEGMRPDTSFKPTPFDPSKVFHLIPYRRHRGCKARPVREILQQIQTAESGATPGLNSKVKCAESPINLLRHVPMKSLKFGEDVRPPYQGTFTRAVPLATANKLARNPYHRALPGMNYDYESEAEWEEPEEGEDLDSEEEEEDGDDGDDDMDGFLDDDDDTLVGGKRRLIVGDLEPVCSGLTWAVDGVPNEMKQYGMVTISDAVKFPIDPFSTVYWQKSRALDHGQGKNMPHRPQTLDAFRAHYGGDAPAVGSAVPLASKAKRPFPPEHLSEFKQVVEGSDLSKIGVVEILKKRYVHILPPLPAPGDPSLTTHPVFPKCPRTPSRPL